MSVLDTACARLALGQNAIPAQSKIGHAPARRSCRCRSACCRAKQRSAPITRERLAVDRDSERERPKQTLAELQARWEKERELVNRIREIRGKIEGAVSAPAAAPRRRAQPRRRSAARLGRRSTGCAPNWRSSTANSTRCKAKRR